MAKTGITDATWNPIELEVAARRYCELIGDDPDRLVGHGAEPNADGVALAIWLQSPLWKLVAAEIRKLDLMQHAIGFAKGYE